MVQETVELDLVDVGPWPCGAGDIDASSGWPARVVT